MTVDLPRKFSESRRTAHNGKAEIGSFSQTPPIMRIVIDSREQTPYSFPDHDTVVKGLASGDYSLEGYEDQIAIERKSKVDAFGSLGHGRARFLREMERLSRFDFAAIIIESSLTNFLKPLLHSRMNPQSAFASLCAWAVKFNVHIFFADDREHGNDLTFQLLSKWFKYRVLQAVEPDQKASAAP